MAMSSDDWITFMNSERENERMSGGELPYQNNSVRAAEQAALTGGYADLGPGLGAQSPAEVAANVAKAAPVIAPKDAGTKLSSNDYMASLGIKSMDDYNRRLKAKQFNPNDPAAKAVLANIMKNQGGQASPSLLPVVLTSPNLSTAPLGSIASRDGGKTTAELIGQATAPQYNPNVDHASNVYNTQYGSYIDEVQLQGPGNSNNRYDGKYNPNDPRAYDPADIPVEQYIRNTLSGSTIDAIQAANAGVTDEGGFYPQGGSQIDMSNIIQPKQRTHAPANGYIQFMRNGGKQ